MFKCRCSHVKGSGIGTSHEPMFECRACIWRSIRAVAGESLQTNQILARRPLLLDPRLQQTAFRQQSSTAVATKPRSGDLVQGSQPVDAVQTKGIYQKGRYAIDPKDERHLKLELKYLQDKFKLAEHVHYTLRCEQPLKALDLCRLASKQQNVIVSWNHCVDWYMKRGKHDEAVKIYNEMKKRAQFPDGHTYSILLHGLATPPNKDGVVSASNVTKALNIYYSMSSPTSRVAPNIIHTNNVLKVCKAALDMDALWGVVSKLPEEGPGAPDQMTYTILLDAIRSGVFGNDEDNVYAEQLAGSRYKAVQEGRTVWRDVIKRWRNGQIHMDERLVIAMASLLLKSPRIQDWDDVLNLFQQTANIERLLPELGSPNRHIDHVPQSGTAQIAEMAQEEDEDGYRDTPTGQAFQLVQPHARDSLHQGRPSTLTFVKPGNGTLSILVHACSKLHSPKAARAYWDLLTSPDGIYKVQPERGNYHTYLRLLGSNRSSSQAIQFLRHMADSQVPFNYVTFRIVMSICDRDKKNKHMLDNARTVIDVMEKTLPLPDARTLTKYLDLALFTDDGPKIVFAVNRLDSILHTLRSRVLYGTEKTGMPHEQHLAENEEILRLFRTTVGVVDTLVRRGLVPQEDYTHWQGRRQQLDAFISRATKSTQASRQRLEGTKQNNPFEEIDPKRSDGSFGLRTFRWRGREEKIWAGDIRERSTSRSLLEWKVSDAKPDVPTKSQRISEWRNKKGWRSSKYDSTRPVYADSPMELAER